jgi:hypothetical protein
MDAAPACPTATHACVAPVPSGWSGPVVGTQAASSAPLAECPANFATEAKRVFEDLVAQGSCACECPGVPANVLCSNASIEAREGTSTFACNELCQGACSLSLPPGGICTSGGSDINDAPALRISLGRVSNSGSCSPPLESNDFEAQFARQERYCSGEVLAASCPDEGLCLPTESDEPFASLCIFQEGDHECPAAYPEKALRFEGFDDTRTCSSCACTGPAVNSSCGGTVSIGQAGTSAACLEQDITTNGCIAHNPGTPVGARYAPAAEFTCSPSGAELSGEATAVDPVTFCCVADA